MSKSKKIAILPKLHDYNGDVNKQWFVYFTCKNPKNNKMVRFRIYEGFSKFKTPHEKHLHAKKLISSLIIKLEKGWFPFKEDNSVILENSTRYYRVAEQFKKARKNNKTWEFYLSEYISDKKPLIRESTYHTYSSKIRIFLRWLKQNNLDGNDINELSYQDIKNFYRYLFNSRKVAGRMANSYTTLFNDICRRLVDENILKENPFEKIRPYAKSTKPPKPFTEILLHQMKNYLIEKDIQMWTVCQFIFYCFIRPIELRFLKIKDIDFISGKVAVPGSISKNHKTQPVIIPIHFLQYLIDNGYNKANNEFYVFTKDGKPGLVPLYKNYMFNHFDKMRKELNIPKEYKFYGWKHTGGLKLKQSGADLIEMQQQFRHHSLDQLNQYLKGLEGLESEHIRYRGYVL